MNNERSIKNVILKMIPKDLTYSELFQLSDEIKVELIKNKNFNKIF